MRHHLWLLLLLGCADDAPFEAPDTWVGNVAISSAAELPQLDGIVRIEGRLTLSGELPEDLVLSELVSVRETLVLQQGGPRRLTLPALAEVGGIETRGQVALQRLDVPVLHTVAASWRGAAESRGDFVVAAPEVVAPALRVVEGNLDLGVEPSLVLPALERAGRIRFNRSPLRIDLPKLHSLDLLDVDGPDDAPKFALSLPALRELGYAFFGALALTEVSLPALERVRESLGVLGPQLMLRLPSLREAGGISLCTGESLDAPVLLRADEIDASCVDSALRTVSLPAMQSVTQLRIAGAPLRELTLTSLQRAGMFRLASSSVTELALPALTTLGGLELHDNAALLRVSAPVLEELGRVSARANGGALCSLDQLSSKLRAPSEVVFNGEACQ